MHLSESCKKDIIIILIQQLHHTNYILGLDFKLQNFDFSFILISDSQSCTVGICWYWLQNGKIFNIWTWPSNHPNPETNWRFPNAFCIFRNLFPFLLPSAVSKKFGWKSMSGSRLNAPEFRLQPGARAIYQSEIFLPIYQREIFSKLFPITQKLTTTLQLLLLFELSKLFPV